MRAPITCWLSLEKWRSISPKEREFYLYKIPEFLIELRTSSDHINSLQDKCHEWIENGVQLLWLIDPKSETSWIYRADGSIEEVKGFDKILSGEDILPGFQFKLSKLYLPE